MTHTHAPARYTSSHVIGTRVRFGGGDDAWGIIMGTETHNPDGFRLPEPLYWVQWPDSVGADLLTADELTF